MLGHRGMASDDESSQCLRAPGPWGALKAQRSHAVMSGSYLAAWGMLSHGQGMHWEVIRVFAYGLTCSQLYDADKSTA